MNQGVAGRGGGAPAGETEAGDVHGGAGAEKLGEGPPPGPSSTTPAPPIHSMGRPPPGCYHRITLT